MKSMETRLKSAMKKAILFEEKGYNIYREVASTSFNPLVKKTFSFLADQEMDHIKEIKKYIEKENIKIALNGAKLKEIKEFFNLTIDDYKEGTEFSKSELIAYEKAKDLETSSYDYYKSQFEQSRGAAEKRFFKFLMEQEAAHYMLIDNILHFLKEPEQFYAEQENWIFEG